MLVKELNKLTLADLWKEVKSEEFGEDLKPRTQKMLKLMLEGCLQEDLRIHLNAFLHERTNSRRDYRNGYYLRDLETELGALERINVPRPRRGNYETRVFERYQRRQKKVNKLVKEMFLAGVSTRRIGEVIEPLLGRSVSAQTVSSIVKSLR